MRPFQRLRAFRPSPPVKLLLFLVAGKAAVFSYVLLTVRSLDAFRLMSLKWDGAVYQGLATHGYQSASSYVFSPIYPALIGALSHLIGITWISAYLVTNALSFIFPVLLYRAYGYRTAFFAEMFPTFLLFGTIPYSDVIALVFLAGCLLLLVREKVSPASAAMSGAILTFFNLAWVLPSFFIALLRSRPWRNLVFYVLPFATGGLILLWLRVETGAYFDLLKLEAPWGMQLSDPVGQAYYLLCAGGSFSFTCQHWQAGAVLLPPPYWLLRNIAFEAFYISGAFYLLRTQVKYKVFLCAYSLSVTVPLLFWNGFIALSIPRLLLPAFPVFIGYSDLLKKYQTLYAAVCMLLAADFSVMQYLAYFS